jgi:starch synthase (maltosyl-transferring)
MVTVADGRNRVIIEDVKPEIDSGRFPIKRTVSEKVIVEADVFTDGHDALSCVLLYRRDGESQWKEAPMDFLVNDRWRGEFAGAELGQYRYAVQAWVDHFTSWHQGLLKKFNAGQDVSMALLTGAELIEQASERARSLDRG